MNFAAFNFVSVLPRGFIATLVVLTFLAVTGEATGPRAHVNGARGATPHVAMLARCNDAIFGAREARPDLPVAGMASGFGVTMTSVGGARGGAAGNPVDFSVRSSSAGRTLAPTAQLAEASMKEHSAVSIRRRISAAQHTTKQPAAGHTAAGNNFRPLPACVRVSPAREASPFSILPRGVAASFRFQVSGLRFPSTGGAL